MYAQNSNILVKICLQSADFLCTWIEVYFGENVNYAPVQNIKDLKNTILSDVDLSYFILTKIR